MRQFRDVKFLSVRLENFATESIALWPDGSAQGRPFQQSTARFAQFAFQQLTAGILGQSGGRDNPLGALESAHVPLTGARPQPRIGRDRPFLTTITANTSHNDVPRGMLSKWLNSETRRDFRFETEILDKKF